MNINTKTLPNEYKFLEKSVLIEKIKAAKQKLCSDLLILGHHYQIDDILNFADIKGDSLVLAQEATKSKAKYIVFCGVHFMAEAADILTRDDQIVMLPEIKAGCNMADLAEIDEVEFAFSEIKKYIDEKIIPVTYVNSGADLKAFCGKNDGIVCTSSNAEEVIKWAFKQGQRLFFFPDQHLGRNTSYKLGYKLEEMVTWDAKENLGGNDIESIKNAKIYLWHGYCYVHQKFKPADVERVRKEHEGIKVIVHPECKFEVASISDSFGSTGQIIKEIKNAEKGSKWAIGTESNLVIRLKKQYENDLFITSLSNFLALCVTMNKIQLPHLAWILDEIVAGNIVNQVTVDKEIAKYSKIALDRMLNIS